ncbi:MAG TPA: CotH kinase family protein [Paenalcaligenes sp.]|nr:CotH kinase family protein [Paenalcaligenes sp.]
MIEHFLSALMLAAAHSVANVPGTPPLNTHSGLSEVGSDCQVVINEFMSAKQTMFADEDGEYNDWIELYNCTDQDIDLQGWYLSDRVHRLDKWVFPKAVIPANGYLTLWASGKDRYGTDTDSPQSLHTNFSIDASGEHLLLSDNEGNIIDSVEPIPLETNEVAGRSPDGVGPFSILNAPTPDEPNSEILHAALLPAPKFSQPAGIYAHDFDVSLEHKDADATIFYTLDGSIPDPENLEGQTFIYKNNYAAPHEIEDNKTQAASLKGHAITHRYTTPIRIQDRSAEPDRIAGFSTTIGENPDYFPEPEFSDHWMNNVVQVSNDGIAQLNRAGDNLNNLFNRIVRNIKQWHSGEKRPVGKTRFVVNVPQLPYWEYTGKNLYKGTVIRAIAAKEVEGRLITSPVATQTYFIDKDHQLDLPIISIAAAEKDLFGYEDGILVAGATYEQWLNSGTATPEIGTPSFPANWKKKSRAAGQFQILDPTGQSSGSYSTELRSHGNAARAFKTKSIRLYPQDAVTFPIFADDDPTLFSRINLRIDRDTRLHDDISHNLLHGLAFATQRSEPYLVFINGEYYAILAAKDRRDSTFLRHQYGLINDDFDLLAFDYANQVDVQGPVREAKKGDFSHWDNMLERLRQDPDLPMHEIEKHIDLQSFIDYHAAEIYLVNSDWPTNNNSFWRYKGNTPNNHALTDGKWRWLLYDLDRAFRRPETNMLKQTYQLSEEKDPIKASELYKILIKHPEVKQRFITRFADLINTTFAPERVTRFIKHTRELLEKEMPQHIARWGSPISMGYWEGHLDNMVEFANKRPDTQRQHLKEFFNLGDAYTVTINVLLDSNTEHELTPVEDAAIIELNTLQLGVTDDELTPPIAASSRATEMTDFLRFPWAGQYFSDMPLELKITARPGYAFSHWEGDLIEQDNAQDSSLNLTPTKDLTINAIMIKEPN